VSGVSFSNDGDVSGNHGHYEAWVVSLYPGGSVKWKKAVGGSSFDAGYNIIQTADTGFLITAATSSNDQDASGNGFHGTVGGTDFDIWLIKLSSVTDIPQLPNNSDIAVYPTITNGIVHIDLPQGFEQAKMKVTNFIGQSIDLSEHKNGLNREIQLKNAAAGSYLLQVLTKDGINSFKLLYQP
jgi:hypothetical protein